MSTPTNSLESLTESCATSTTAEEGIQAPDTSNVPSEKHEIKRDWRFYGAFGTLCILTLIIALDSTILSVALPVSTFVSEDRDFLWLIYN